MRCRYFCLLLSICLFSTVPVLQCQNSDPNNDTGIRQYETYDGAHENINLGSGNAFISVPLLTLPGRNGLNYSVSLMSNSQSWSPMAGWQNKNLGMVVTRAGDISVHPTGSVLLADGNRCITGYQMTDENGGVHTFSGIQSNCGHYNSITGNWVPATFDDALFGEDDRGEGITIDLQGCTVSMKNGNWVPLLSGSSGCPNVGVIGNGSYPQVLEDSDGNQIHVSALDGSSTSSNVVGGGDLFPTGTDYDTLNRAITYTNNSATTKTIQYEDSNGTQRTITLNVQSFTLSSCVFGYPGTGFKQPSGTANVITSAVLPDGLTYIFHYDQCGGLDKIVYPSGGYTRYVIDYLDYSHGIQGLAGGPFTYIELVQKYVCRAPSVSLYATSTGEQQGVAAGNTCKSTAEDKTIYAPNANSVCANSANTVLDPLGNQTSYQFLNTGKTCGLWSVVESQRQIYQGTSTLLRTIQTQYVGTLGYYPAIQTTIIGSGPKALESQIQWDYWCGCSDDVKEKREFAWGQGGPGALVRTTDYGQNYCYDKKPSETVYAGSSSSGTLIAQTTYVFDGYGTAGLSASGAVQHGSTNPSYPNRCNVTAVNVWRNTDGATLTTSYQYDDAGNKVSVTAPSNSSPIDYDNYTRTTTYSYADVWGTNSGATACAPTGGNAAAYPTKITDPAGLITQHSYNSCTGTVATTTDPNSQVTSFSYDLMDRLIQTNFPDNGQISTCFSEVSGSSCNQSNYPLQVQTSQKITSTMSKVTTALLDGLARVSETQLNSDPDCTASGGTKVDTTYDGDEHKSTVTNPYCTTSDATYGVTTYQYDGLDRVTKVIPPDGTSTSNNVASSYDSLPIVGLPVNNCTIVTDQVGNQRRSCSDALGRLMEVDEPSDVVGATPGSGSVTITGSERYYLYTYTCGPNGQTCQTNIPDVGNVSITVNGVSATVSYGSNSTPAIIASALATAVNNGALPVTASVNGSVVTLTATTTGAATNYSLTASSATTDTTYFTGTSFPATPSGSILTGGTDGSQGNGSLSINSPAVTLYQYDVLNNLLRVDQKGNQPPDSTKWRTRTFAYNSLSQLLCAANPEITPVGTTCPNPDNGAYTPGTVRYAYDNEGNLITKTSPAPNQLSSSVTVQTAYTYKDPDNRLTQKSYNDGLTPTASFAYDGNTPTNCTTSPPAQSDPYPLGRRTSMCDVSGGTSWSHDPMGRIANEKRTIVGTSNITNTTTYAPYNLDGSVQTITYPGTGTVITYLYSKAGRAISGEDNGNSNDYAYSATYAPFGGLTALTMGTAPIKLANAYNNRLQPLLISASAGSTIMSLCYDFHSGIAYASCLFPAYTSGNNGNIFQIVNGRDSNRTQNFNYDALNRIANAYTNGTNWGESFTIDAWGNLTNRGPYSGKTNYESLSASATGQNQLTGFGYDAAGNMTSNNGAGYTYDAENHLVFTGGYAYFYDGDGNRVKKCTSSAAFSCQSSPSGTLYWRGAGGDQLLESSLAGASQEEYIFFNGKRIARRDVAGSMVHYYFSDHLGTHSIVTDQNGDMPPQYESDFYPYGGEIPITTGDPNHYKFTGKERDTESGLDNFGARFDASSLGRFMTLDPVIVARGRMVDPQQLNRYAYVRNNPVRWIDPTGEILMCNGATAEAKCYCYHYLEEILGNAAALLSIDPNMLSMDPNTGRISFDTSGINLSTNEGAALINDLVQSPHTYGLSIGPKVDTVGGLTDVDEILNLPPTEDQLRHGSPTPTETPVGVEDQVAFNPNPRRERISLRGLKLAVPYTLVFHELAEAYAKVDGGMKTYEGAHNAAAAREDKLRDERPYLKVFNPGSGGRTNEPSYQGVLGVIKDR